MSYLGRLPGELFPTPTTPAPVPAMTAAQQIAASPAPGQTGGAMKSAGAIAAALAGESSPDPLTGALAEFTQSKVGEVVAERASGRRVYRARIGNHKNMTANGRLYPLETWRKNVDRVNSEMCQKGRFFGSADHPSDGNAVKSTAIMWNRLEITDDGSGSVIGEFEVLDTAAGMDIQKMLDAGADLGFSTFGYGVSRSPTPKERQKYSIPYDRADARVVDGWDLKRVDVVDSPAASDAWLIRT